MVALWWPFPSLSLQHWKCPEFFIIAIHTIYMMIMTIIRFRMVKVWFPQNAFFSLFFTGRAFIMVYYILKLVLEFQFDLQNPLKQPKTWIFENGKLQFLAKILTFFGPNGVNTVNTFNTVNTLNTANTFNRLIQYILYFMGLSTNDVTVPWGLCPNFT